MFLVRSKAGLAIDLGSYVYLRHGAGATVEIVIVFVVSAKCICVDAILYAKPEFSGDLASIVSTHCLFTRHEHFPPMHMYLQASTQGRKPCTPPRFRCRQNVSNLGLLQRDVHHFLQLLAHSIMANNVFVCCTTLRSMPERNDPMHASTSSDSESSVRKTAMDCNRRWTSSW